MSDVFDAYAAYYDLLYRDKDYAGEVDYLHRLIQQHAPGAASLLELGCGTGAHAALLARLGYSVHGLDMSEPMLDRARTLADELPPEQSRRLTFEHGDVRDWRGERTFDAVLSLFHVFSYQVLDTDIKAAFSTASTHLPKGGLLIFDFWYGPAVLAQMPEPRIKHLQDDRIRLTRNAVPTSFPEEHRVDVRYDMRVEDQRTGEDSRFAETHQMRYFFASEIEALARNSGLEPIVLHEWMTDQTPGAESWSAMFIGRRCT